MSVFTALLTALNAVLTVWGKWVCKSLGHGPSVWLSVFTNSAVLSVNCSPILTGRETDKTRLCWSEKWPPQAQELTHSIYIRYCCLSSVKESRLSVGEAQER